MKQKFKVGDYIYAKGEAYIKWNFIAKIYNIIRDEERKITKIQYHILEGHHGGMIRKCETGLNSSVGRTFIKGEYKTLKILFGNANET